MARYAAFLRGMNLGNRRVSNDELRKPFEVLGYDDVACFRASGNVIFSFAKSRGPEALTAEIEAELLSALGYEVTVFLRAENEMKAVAATKPFPAKALAASKGKLQVDFLHKPPSAAARKQVLAMASADDLLMLDGRELYWLPRGGTLESGLDHAAIGKLVGVGTRRTMGTVEGIVKKYFL